MQNELTTFARTGLVLCSLSMVSPGFLGGCSGSTTSTSAPTATQDSGDTSEAPDTASPTEAEGSDSRESGGGSGSQ